MAEKKFKEYLKPFTISGKTIYARTVDDAQKQRDMEGAPRKGKAFYTKQRKDAEAKAAKGDKGAKATLASIEAKRAKQRGPAGTSKNPLDVGKAARSGAEAVGKRAAQSDAMMQGVAGKVRGALGKGLGSVGQSVSRYNKAVIANPKTRALSLPSVSIGKPGEPSVPRLSRLGNKNGNGNGKKAGNGSIGTYSGPKPRAYSSLSAADKAKEDRQNERDMAAKKSGNGK